MKSVYVTNSGIGEGEGGSVVSMHELRALSSVSDVTGVFQKIKGLWFESQYPNNPFMLDWHTASSLKREHLDTDVSMFYGGSFTTTMKCLSRGKIITTVAAHNLELSLEEWKDCAHSSVYGIGVPGNLHETPNQHLVNDHVFRILNRGIVETADVVISPSSTSKTWMEQKFELSNIRIVPHGCDIPERQKGYDHPFRVLHLGRCGYDKGDRYLARAWANFVRSFKKPEFDLKSGFDLMVAGSSSELYCNGFNSDIYGGIASWNVRCFGAVTEDTKNDLYRNASVYVQSSVTEGWGIPVGEAMAHGVPVIVTDRTGAQDMVTDGVDGFVIPIRDPVAIENKIRYFWDNPIEIKRMGTNAREKAKQYDWSIVEDMYAKVIKEVTES